MRQTAADYRTDKIEFSYQIDYGINQREVFRIIW